MKPKFALLITLALAVLLIASACSKNQTSSGLYKDSVQTALEQADLKDISVTEDADKNTITLSGALHSDDDKLKATEVAKANAGDRIVVNEITVEPVGSESEAKKVSSDVDDGIEDNYKAALTSKGLDKEHIRFDAKNGVLTLKGTVKSPAQRKEAQQLAQNVPNVLQVLNELDVKR